MKNISVGSKFFHAKELHSDVVLLQVNAPYFSKNCVSFFNNSISLLINQGYKNLIIDLTETEYLDTTCVSMLIQKMIELDLIGGSIRLVVTEDHPRITFSVGNIISQISVYLTVDLAFNDVPIN